jgi:hypothetical protein
MIMGTLVLVLTLLSVFLLTGEKSQAPPSPTAKHLLLNKSEMV